MSRENFAKFYQEYVPTNATLKARLDSSNDPAAFVEIALAEGPKAGFSFTQDDIIDVMEASARKQTSELSDSHLDGVVGGASALPSATTPTVKITNFGKVVPVGYKPGSFPDGSGASNVTTMCCW